MNNHMYERVRRAVARGREVRSAYYDSIDLPDEQELAPAASEEEVVALMSYYGNTLPASYYTFLRLHNGWKMVDGAMDLLSTQEMIDPAPNLDIPEWRRRTLQAGDVAAARSLVIGVSRVTPTRLLLDPSRIGSVGEWIVVQYHNSEEFYYDSFMSWLEDSIVEFEQLIEDGF